jgi:acetyl esterase/lipase
MAAEEARRINDREAPIMFGPVEPVFSVEEREIANGLRARIYRPVAREVLPVLMYFHGGGWVVGSLDSHDGVARFLANHAGSLVISVDYRLGPENRFPAAVEDAWASMMWAHEHAADGGGDASRLAVGGDSSGGNLAAVVARRARDDGLGLVMQLLVYPVLDCVNANWEENSAWWLSQYLRSGNDALDPDASPLRAADLRGVAPAVILSVPDQLQDQAEAYVIKLNDAGVHAEHFCFPGLIHGAFRMPAVLDGAREMLAASAAALDETFNRR